MSIGSNRECRLLAVLPYGRTGYLTLLALGPYLPLLITKLQQTSPDPPTHRPGSCWSELPRGKGPPCLGVVAHRATKTGSTTNILATGGSGAPRIMMLEKVSKLPYLFEAPPALRRGGAGSLLDPIRKAFRACGLRFSATGGPAYGWQVSGFRLPALPMSRY